MGIVKQDFMNVRLSAEIDEQEWNEIPNEYINTYNHKLKTNENITIPNRTRVSQPDRSNNGSGGRSNSRY